jgi:hypothetical protein
MDDVQYLVKHSFEEEYVCVVDSARRNRTEYPTPSEYVVEFDTPFTNVYSIDVIDVQVPRSGYIIDTFNNTLVFRFVLGNGPTEWFKRTIQSGNYDRNSLRQELNAILKDPNDPERFIFVSDDSRPFEKSNKLKFESKFSFDFDISESLARTVIGFGEVDGIVSSNIRNPTGLFGNLFRGTVVGDQQYPITRDKHPIQRVVAPTTGISNTLSIKIGQIGTPPPSTATSTESRVRFRIVRLVDDIEDLQVFNRVLDVSEPGTLTIDFDVENDPTAPRFSFEFLYAIYLTDDVNTDINNCWTVHYGEAFLEAYHGNLSVLELGYVKPYYDATSALEIFIGLEGSVSTIVPSGIVNLFGERYIQLRCPEVEEHMYRNRAFEKYNVGLAIITTSREYETLSQRYVLIPSRKFHPIGKLKRMTFRFETSSGFLYNFNGIDHTITLVIRYYKVNEAPMLEPKEQVLNGQYRSDYFEYLRDVIHRDADSEEDSGNDDLLEVLESREEAARLAATQQYASLRMVRR